MFNVTLWGLSIENNVFLNFSPEVSGFWHFSACLSSESSPNEMEGGKKFRFAFCFIAAVTSLLSLLTRDASAERVYEIAFVCPSVCLSVRLSVRNDQVP